MQETDALIIRSVDYRERDRVLTLLTRGHGRVSALARGARGSKGGFSAMLQPYTLLRLRLRVGRGAMCTVTGAHQVRVYPGILADLQRMRVAGAGLGLVGGLCPDGQPEPEIFALAMRWLEVMEDRGDPAAVRLLGFAVHALSLLGYAPQLDHCGHCGKPAPVGRAACFAPVNGGIVCRACGGSGHVLSGCSRRLLGAASAGDWEDLPEQPWPREERAAARRALMAMVEAQLDPRLASRLQVEQTPGAEAPSGPVASAGDV